MLFLERREGGRRAQNSSKQLRLFGRFEVLLQRSQSIFKINAGMNEGVETQGERGYFLFCAVLQFPVVLSIVREA